MRRFNNCTSSIIFVMILFFVWSLDCQNAMARVFYENGIKGSPSYTNVVDKENKMANYIKKWCQNESRGSEKSMKDYENHDDLNYESSSHLRSSSKETQHLETRLLIEDKWSQGNQIISMVATVGGSLFILVVVIMFCSKKPEEQEETEDQHDEIIGLTQSPSEKIENSDDKDLGKCDPSFHISSIKQDNMTLDKQDVQEGSKDSNETLITAHVLTPPTPPPSRGPVAPPPPVGGKGPPPPAPPLKGGKGPPPPPNPGNPGKRAFGKANDNTFQDNHRTKLKPFFWDKVLANSEQSMVWDEIRAGSFQFNEDMIESLFGYNPDEKKINDRRGKKADSLTTFIHIIDSKKAQNLSILLKAINVTTEEVSDALLEGQELPGELLQTLIRMAPTSEEELKLRLYSGDLSQIGPAERFLKVLVDIPFAFKRMECLLFMMSLKEEASGLKESFSTLEAACDALKSNRLFLKILEAVLKTGNRMNAGTYRGSAQAFKLNTLLKLSDVKATDGKTNLLQFVIQEIVRTEGIKVARAAIEKYSTSKTESDGFLKDSTTNPLENCRALGLQVVLSLSTDLEIIKKAAIIDSDSLTSTVAKLGQSLLKTKDFLNREMHDLGEESRFYHALKDFVDVSESEITELLGEERRIMDLVKKTVDYFQGSSTREDGLQIFVIVRDFLIVLDKTCADIKKKMDQDAKTTNKGKSVKTTPQDSTPSSRGALEKNGQNKDHESSSDNKASSSSQTSSTKEKPMKDGNDGASTSQTSSNKEKLIEENISSTKEISMKEDNKILHLMRASSSSSSSKGKQIIEDNEILSLLRTYSVKGKSIQEDNEVSSFSRTSSTKEKLLIGSNEVLSKLRVSYNKEKLTKGDNEVASTSQTSSTKALPIKYDNEAPSISQTSSMKQESPPKEVSEDSDKKSPTKENQIELSSQESDRQTSSIDDMKNKALTKENIIEEMRQKLFPTLQDSHFDESSSSSDSNDELQNSTKGCLTEVSSHESKVSPQAFQPQTSVGNKQIKQVSSYGKVIDARQQRLFQGIQNRWLDDSSSDSSSGDDS